MPDFDSLSDAFAELERRADAAGEQPQPAPPLRHPHRVALVGATVAGVAAVALGSALLVGSSGHSDHRAPAAGPQPSSVAPPTPTAPSSGTPSSSAPSSSAPSIVGSEIPMPSNSAPSNSAPPSNPAPEFRVPHTAQQLADRFRVVLDGSATFTLRDAGVKGAFITGTLTSKSGVSGGFDLQIFQNDPGSKAICEDPGFAVCSVHRLEDGSSLATGHESLGGIGVTYQADLILPSGIDLHMHVSNESDPKGESEVLSNNPPLSIDDMVSVLTSKRW